MEGTEAGMTVKAVVILGTTTEEVGGEVEVAEDAAGITIIVFLCARVLL